MWERSNIIGLVLAALSLPPIRIVRKSGDERRRVAKRGESPPCGLTVGGRMQGDRPRMARIRMPTDPGSGKISKEYYTPHESQACSSRRACRGSSLGRSRTGLSCGAPAGNACPHPGSCARLKHPPPVAPTAYPTKIALVDFSVLYTATNEGQQAMLDVQQKYEPRKAQLDQEPAEIDTLQKKLQATPATLSEDERAARRRASTPRRSSISASRGCTAPYQSDVQEALGKIAQKFYPVVTDYVEKNGYTLLINVSESQSTPSSVMWTRRDPNADITEAVIAAYNAVSKVAAPAPSAPSATRPKPATTPTTRRA